MRDVKRNTAWKIMALKARVPILRPRHEPVRGKDATDAEDCEPERELGHALGTLPWPLRS